MIELMSQYPFATFLVGVLAWPACKHVIFPVTKNIFESLCDTIVEVGGGVHTANFYFLKKDFEELSNKVKNLESKCLPPEQ